MCLFGVSCNLKKAFKILDKVASIGANTLNFTDLGSPYEGPPSTPQSGMDAPDAPHTPKYMDGGSTASITPGAGSGGPGGGGGPGGPGGPAGPTGGNIPGKSAFVELQQHAAAG